MEHQVFVPVPPDRLRAALADPARVARAVPGLQQDAGAEPVAGRLKLRVGGHSVTYRGALRITPRADGTYSVEGDATEARGTGGVELALTVRLADTEDGTTVTVEGTADADGRIAELPQDAVGSALTRLLTRWVEALAESPGPQSPEKPAAESGSVPEAEHTSVFDTEVPPSSLAPDADDDTAAGCTAAAADRLSGDGLSDDRLSDDRLSDDRLSDDRLSDDRLSDERFAEDFADTGEPPAEAAHARRTMIGRSAEEVDHAPPRGRYAPVPAPQTATAGPALRWAAPAAALALASAIVVGRALRRRR
ncbi:carbon monoxide dehydrogenase subunit G [Streptomyces griseochromogenes]|uniref:Carbon monoxide dehydrogenase subunit G n=1 Tax=Streptomyces griseochromogenes TaxID=68214 RepID=A0A1B1BBV1_9ACTN|nr:SRPBCC family protein [Streptomyces griseochromogenes]ANP56239.1 carbon monoxide dehydrogenase subunit G [Streptomyces griseochromogenes]MBP2052848.1 carbon monoxide dehydrogenase subunit G [Streptomyces griseochromogenes]